MALIQKNTARFEFDSVADVQATAKSGFKDDQIAYIKGILSTNNDGSGNFRYDASSSATDDGATIIEPTGTGNGRFFRVFGETISVKDFGATGDGTTNDSVAILAAIAAVDAAGGGEVFIPSGSYYIGTTSLSLGKQGTSIRGVSAGGRTNERHGSRIRYEGTSAAINLTIDDSGDPGSGLGWMSNLYNLHIDCNKLNGATDGSIGIRAGNADGTGVTSWYGIVENCFVTGAAVAGIKVVGTQIGQFNKVHCEINDGVGWWITYDARNPGNLSNTITSFYDCRATDNVGKGFLIDQGFDMCFFNCTSEANGDLNWHITDTSAATKINFFGGWEEGTGGRTGFKIDGGTVKFDGFIHNSEPDISGVIAGVTDLGGGVIRIADVAHGLVAGDWIEIAGTTNYNGDIEVSNVNDVDTFDVVATYVSSQTGTWETIYGNVVITGGDVAMENPFFSEQANKPTVRVADGATCLVTTTGESIEHFGVESKARLNWGGRNRSTADNNPFDAHAKSITAVADAGGGDITLSVTAHGYLVGDRLTIVDTTSYDSPTETVTNVVDADNFDVTATWVSNQTGRCASSVIKYNGGDIVMPLTASGSGEGYPYGWICASVIGYPGIWYELGQGRIRHKTTSTSAASKSVGSFDSTLLCDATSNTITVILKDLGLIPGKEYFIQKVDSVANTVTVSGFGGADNINGATTYALTAQWDSVTVRDVGTHWAIVSTT